MAIREYKCSCKCVKEVIMPTQDVPPEFVECPKCGSPAPLVQFSRTGLVTSNFQENTLDVAIGADSDKKWAMYAERQEERNKVRKETGSLGLTEMNGTYVPIPESRKAAREARLPLVSQGIPEDPEMIY